MESKTQTNVKWIAAIGLITILILILWNLWWKGGAYSYQDFGNPPSWRGITPGLTSLIEVEQLLGEPDEIEERNEFTVYIYEKRDGWGWENIEIMFADREHAHRVIGILLSYQYIDGKSVAPIDPEIMKLRYLVVDYGQPDKVTWEITCGYRLVIWARQGVTGSVFAGSTNINSNKVYVSSLFFFEPMDIDLYLHSNWPLPQLMKPISFNPCPPGSGIDYFDDLPEDPFD